MLLPALLLSRGACAPRASESAPSSRASTFSLLAAARVKKLPRGAGFGSKQTDAFLSLLLPCAYRPLPALCCRARSARAFPPPREFI